MVLENFIREIIADEVRQLRIQTNDNTKDFNVMRHQFIQDRLKINNCEKSVKKLVKRQKELDEDPLAVTRMDIDSLNVEMKTLQEYVFEKFTLLADMDRGIGNRIEVIEKKVFDEPQHVLNYLKKEVD